jgi:hypothetical protein
MARGMEFQSEYVFIEDLATRLAELSQDEWAVDFIVPGHANIFEMGSRASVLVVVKRPKKKKDDD